MGFRYFGYGDCLECECDGKEIIVYRHNGEIERFPTNLTLALPRQQTYFEGVGIMWVLYDENKSRMFIGRQDGSVSGYFTENDLLMFYGRWTVPPQIPVKDVGAYFLEDITYRVVLNGLDNRTCYILGLYHEYVFNKPNFDIYVISDAIAKCINGNYGLHIVSLREEVNVNENGHWFMADFRKSRDRIRFI